MVTQEVNQYSNNRPRFFYGYIVVIAAFFIMVLMFGTRSTFGVFFKPTLNEVGWTRAQLSGAYAISVIVQGLLGIIMGGLTDRFGSRSVMTLCGFLLGLGYLLMSQINYVWQLYLFYAVIMGIGMGGSFVTPLSTVARWFVKKRGMMTGIVLAGLGTGTLIVPPVFNWLISIYGWRTSYIIMGIVALVMVILASQFLRRPPAQIGQAPYGENKERDRELNLGARGLSFKEAIYTRQLWMTFVMYFCLGFCAITINVHIVPHVTDLGISPANAAFVLAVVGGVSAVGGITLGGVADRIGNRQVFIICFILISPSLFWLVAITELWMLYLFAIILGVGNGGGAMLESPLAAELFGMKSHGSIFGVLSCGFTIGAAVGPFLAGYIFDITGSYQLAFVVSAMVGVFGIILAAIIRPIKGL